MHENHFGLLLMFDIQPHGIIVFTYVRYILEEVLFIFVRVNLSEGSLKLL